jgi:glutamyl-tRNA(Gln) amidotransferase subunit E
MSDSPKRAVRDEKYYRSIGFACGLEIHQRLATPTKLFCSCSAGMSTDHFDGSIRRQQRAVSGELGGVDTATQFEGMKRRDFSYDIFKSTTCLVDLDEEPPHDISKEALAVSLAIGKSLGLKFFDELQPMRKGVVDGSDPSAFQRTILIGMDGALDVNGKRIGITMISLEEESSGIKSSSGSEAAYTTERLGVPLIEIDTDPSISSAQEAKEVALKIGTLLRLTGLVQRGIGSIRQDLNISIKDGARVEIKGLQELDLMDSFVDVEIERQQKLLEIKASLLKAKATVGGVEDLTHILKGSEVKIVKDQIAKGGSAFGFKLGEFAGVLGKEVGPGRRLGSEISDYAKMAGVGGIIHSDEDLSKYGFDQKAIHSVRKELKIGDSETSTAFIIVAGGKGSAKRAAEIARDRAKEAMVGIPKETRAVLSIETCTTRFMRPLAGGSRMYPETDILPIPLTDKMLKAAESSAPNIEKEKATLEKQLGKDLAAQMITSVRLPLYRFVVKSLDLDPQMVANIILQKFTELKRAGFETDSISRDLVLDLFTEYKKDRITKQGIEEVLKELAKGKSNVGKVISDSKLERMTGKKLDETIKAELAGKGATLPKGEALRHIMSKYRMNVDGQEVSELLGKIYKS